MSERVQRVRRREKSKGTVNAAQPVPSSYIVRNAPCFEILGEEALVQIEDNAERVLQEIGIEFREDVEVLDLWRNAGADVKQERVRFPRGLVKELAKTAPAVFTQHARNPERNVQIGGNAAVFAPVYGPPFVRDLEAGRRYGTIEDFCNFVKLAYMCPSLHHSGGTVCEPVDLPVNTRHLDMVASHVLYSDKPFMGSVTAPSRAEDTVEMAKIVFGDEFVDKNCVLISLINANSPMVFDSTMLGALKVYARNNQASIISPFILAGAMSPVTVAGTLSQVWAEAMTGVALTQLIRPGSPVVFGAFVSSISMQSGAPTFGTPEGSLLLSGAAQLARRARLPFRSGGSFCASKIPDAQAAYETSNTLNTTLISGVNFVLHAAGWLEGGLCSSYEKFIMDADQLAMLEVLAKGVTTDDNALAFEALEEVGPGGHFLGCAHTQKNFRDAFYRSPLSDNNSVEQWEAEGSKDMAQRAYERWNNLLRVYEPPALDVAKREALEAFIELRKAAEPASYV